jgi:hypothetical protein
MDPNNLISGSYPFKHYPVNYLLQYYRQCQEKNLKEAKMPKRDSALLVAPLLFFLFLSVTGVPFRKLKNLQLSTSTYTAEFSL